MKLLDSLPRIILSYPPRASVNSSFLLPDGIGALGRFPIFRFYMMVPVPLGRLRRLPPLLAPPFLVLVFSDAEVGEDAFPLSLAPTGAAIPLQALTSRAPFC